MFSSFHPCCNQAMITVIFIAIHFLEAATRNNAAPICCCYAMLKFSSIILAAALTFSTFAPPASASKQCNGNTAALSLIAFGLASFVGSIIALGLSWSDFQVTQSCGAQDSECCSQQDGTYSCTPLSAGTSCGPNQHLLCGANMTAPESIRPAWKFPVGVTSAVVMGVSGLALLTSGCVFWVCIMCASVL